MLGSPTASPVVVSSIERQTLSSSVTAAIVASPLPTAVPASLTASRNGGAFGKVLSAKMSGPVADSQGALSSAPREGAKKLAAISKRNSGTALPAPVEKQNSKDNLAGPTAVAGGQPLVVPSFATAQGGNLQAGKGSLDGVPASPNGTESQAVPAASDSGSDGMNWRAQAPPAGDGAAVLAGGRTARRAAAPQLPIPIVPATEGPRQETVESTSLADKPDAAAVADPQGGTCRSPSGPSPSSAGPLTGVTTFAQEQQTSQGVLSGAANREGVTPRVTSSTILKPAATQPGLDPSSAQSATQTSGTPATASEMLDAANAGNAAVSAAPALSKLPPDTSLPTLDDAAGNLISLVNRGSDRPDDAARKKNSGSDSPPQLATSEKTDAPAPQFTIDSRAESKTIALTQPVHPSAVREQQQNADTPSNAVMPVAGHPAGTGPASRGDRSQVVSEPAASSAAESAQPAPTLIQSAQVLERMGKSEIRLGLNSSNFGSIELHTSVNQDRVGASITTSHADLRSAMIAEMPSLEHAIAQHQMRLDSLQVDSRPGAPAGESSASGGNQSGPRNRQQPAGKISESVEDSAAPEVSLPQARTALHSGLNVHA